jgi:hypothetical protein
VLLGEVSAVLEFLADERLAPKIGRGAISTAEILTDRPYVVLYARTSHGFLALHLTQHRVQELPEAAYDLALSRIKSLI